MSPTSKPMTTSVAHGCKIEMTFIFLKAKLLYIMNNFFQFTTNTNQTIAINANTIVSVEQDRMNSNMSVVICIDGTPHTVRASYHTINSKMKELQVCQISAL